MGVAAQGPVCGTIVEGNNLFLTTLYGKKMTSVSFASFGNPTGVCGAAAFAKGSCDASSTVAVVASLCVGKVNCTVPVNVGLFGDPCVGTRKFLSVELKVNDVTIGMFTIMFYSFI